MAQTELQSSPFETRAHSLLAQANYKLWIEHARAENRRELERLIATLHEDCDYEVVPLGQHWRGKDEVREFYRGLWRGIPDVKLTLLNRIDAEDCIVEESEIFGRMDGPLFGVEPSGRELRYRVVIFFPVRDGLFTGERVYFDIAEFARQVPAARALLDGPQT
ncbi:MAG TPA: ester cyclase [Candidatus Dormibacteraeota bacterium]|nr:ester cyclase [Candidatus Dormibacteraeota bacterium]